MNIRGKWGVLAVVELGVLLCSIDATIVVLALPTIAASLGREIADIQWVSIAYTITCAATLSLAGKCADFLGRKRAYLLGFAIFTVASVIGGFASNLWLLVAMRAFTALGTAFLLSSSNAIITSVFPREQHGLALGLGATVFSVGVAAGLSLGALILHVASWRWIFLINFPIGIIALIAGAIVFDPIAVGPPRPRTKPMDWAGAIFSLSGLLCLLLALQWLADARHGLFFLLTAGSATLFYLFIRIEQRAADPILPLWLFSVPEIFTGSVSRVIMRMCGAGVGFTLPFYLQHNLGLTPTMSGMLLLPYIAIFAVAGPLSGHLADRRGSRPVLLTGLAVLFVGVALQLFFPHGATVASGGVIVLIILSQAVMGLGAAMFGSPNTKNAMQAVSREHQAVVSGVLWTTTFIGQSVGTALAAVVLSTSTSESTAPLQNQNIVFALLAASLLVALFLSWRQPAAVKRTPKPVNV